MIKYTKCKVKCILSEYSELTNSIVRYEVKDGYSSTILIGKTNYKILFYKSSDNKWCAVEPKTGIMIVKASTRKNCYEAVEKTLLNEGIKSYYKAIRFYKDKLKLVTIWTQEKET